MQDLIIRTFNRLGFNVTEINNKYSSSPSCYVSTLHKSLSVDIKRIKKMTNGSLQVSPITRNRRTFDLIAIVFENYILIEPMKDHLKSCSKRGYRSFGIFASK